MQPSNAQTHDGVFDKAHLDADMLFAPLLRELQEFLSSQHVKSDPCDYDDVCYAACTFRRNTCLYRLQGLLRHDVFDGAHHTPGPSRLAACCGLDLRMQLCTCATRPVTPLHHRAFHGVIALGSLPPDAG